MDIITLFIAAIILGIVIGYYFSYFSYNYKRKSQVDKNIIKSLFGDINFSYDQYQSFVDDGRMTVNVTPANTIIHDERTGRYYIYHKFTNTFKCCGSNDITIEIIEDNIRYDIENYKEANKNES